MGGPGRAGPNQNRAGPKLARFFRVKILTAQPVLKIGPVVPNSHFRAKTIRVGRAGPGHTGLGHIGPGQIWPGFFRAKNLMAQSGPNFGRTGLAHRVGPILPPLLLYKNKRHKEVSFLCLIDHSKGHILIICVQLWHLCKISTTTKHLPCRAKLIHEKQWKEAVTRRAYFQPNLEDLRICYPF